MEKQRHCGRHVLGSTATAAGRRCAPAVPASARRAKKKRLSAREQVRRVLQCTAARSPEQARTLLRCAAGGTGKSCLFGRRHVAGGGADTVAAQQALEAGTTQMPLARPL